MDLNQKIKNRREELGLTLQDIANYLGVSKPTVQRYESGEIKNLKQETIEKISQILKVSPTYLMGWDKEQTQSIDTITETTKIPSKFTNSIDARIFVESFTIFTSDGFEPDKLDDTEITNFANAILEQIDMMKYKYKK